MLLNFKILKFLNVLANIDLISHAYFGASYGEMGHILEQWPNNRSLVKRYLNLFIHYCLRNFAISW